MEEVQGIPVSYAVIGEPTLAIAKLYDLLAAEDGESCEGRTAATYQPVRSI